MSSCVMHPTAEEPEKGEQDAPRADDHISDSGSQIDRTESYSSFDTSSSDDDVERMSRTQTAQTQPGYGLERHPTALSRIATQRSQHSATVGSLRTRPSKRQAFAGVWSRQAVSAPAARQGGNWPTRKKLIVSALLAFTTFNSTFTSSIFSSANSAVSAKFNVSTEVGTLGMSLYVLGFAFGPTLFSPLSELFGRRLPILIGVFGFTIFQFGVATAENLQTVIICHIYDNRHRGLAITIFTMMVFTGALFAPFIGGFVVDSYLGWRWTEYLAGILGAAAFALDFFFVYETYPPVILIRKAEELRRRTKNWGIHAKQEEVEIDLGELIANNFSRPVRILFSEPVLLLLSIYMAFLYGLLYLFMTVYPIVFQQIHGFNKGVGGLPYFGLIIGEFCGGLFIIAMQPWYNRKLSANDDIPIPEWRLPPAIIGGTAFAAGLFCAASALAANSILRSMAGAGFPLFAPYMFNAIGVNWTGTVLGCVAAVLMPIPLLFYLYGHRIRSKSKFAAEYTTVAKANVTAAEE
ncbi:major facilitator superfamily domain-containing protein [Aspergillus desertorum]